VGTQSLHRAGNLACILAPDSTARSLILEAGDVVEFTPGQPFKQLLVLRIEEVEAAIGSITLFHRLRDFVELVADGLVIVDGPLRELLFRLIPRIETNGSRWLLLQALPQAQESGDVVRLYRANGGPRQFINSLQVALALEQNVGGELDLIQAPVIVVGDCNPSSPNRPPPYGLD
jgi:hypothetical protein